MAPPDPRRRSRRVGRNGDGPRWHCCHPGQRDHRALRRAHRRHAVDPHRCRGAVSRGQVAPPAHDRRVGRHDRHGGGDPAAGSIGDGERRQSRSALGFCGGFRIGALPPVSIEREAEGIKPRVPSTLQSLVGPGRIDGAGSSRRSGRPLSRRGDGHGRLRDLRTVLGNRSAHPVRVASRAALAADRTGVP